VAGVTIALSHTSGGHGPELDISPPDGWDTLWRGSHHMIMDVIAVSATTHAVIPLVGVLTLNCLLKGFRQGAPSLFFNWPWSALHYLVQELEINREHHLHFTWPWSAVLYSSRGIGGQVCSLRNFRHSMTAANHHWQLPGLAIVALGGEGAGSYSQGPCST
jgi:hypothetical protein